MDDITVLITGAGAPGIKGTLYSLRRNFDRRRIRTVGTDISGDVVGRYLCDGFYQVPRPSSTAFIPRLLEICKKEKVDVILPQVTSELSLLSQSRKEFEACGTKVAISSSKAIELSNNKFNLMRSATEMGLPVPRFFLVSTMDSLRLCAEELGFPKKPFVVKPPVSSGMRGLRIVEEKHDLKEEFYTKKPNDVNVGLEDLERILGSAFPELMVTEHLPGIEYSVDILADRDPIVIPRTRDLIRTGITFNGSVEKSEEIIDQSRRLVKGLGLEYACGFQMKLDGIGRPRLLECNPRVQGTMVLSTLAGANIIYGAVKLAFGEELPEFEIRWNTRLMRYWGGIGISDGEVIAEIL
jgi:carbamoyl-phosphate synthase large subunit